MLEQTKSSSLLTGDATWLGTAAPGNAARLAPVTPVHGKEAIAAQQPVLADLARSTGQAGELDSLAYFLATPDALKKTPHLLLIGDHRPTPGNPAAGLLGAVLLFEYSTGLGPGSRVFATADGTGRRDVIARPEMRARIAALAARTLIERGAQIVHLAFCETHDDHEDQAASAPSPGVAEQMIAAEFRAPGKPRIPAEWTLAERDIPSYLPLLATFDETLARIGQKTRANLRYYRRRLESERGCLFVPEVQITRDEFLAFNRECTYAVPDAMAAFRFDHCCNANHRLRGVRDRDGRWLSLVGIRRQNHFVDIDWQMNRAGLPAQSLGTVIRSYLIEHEIALGSVRLYIEGGTPQPIERSFLRQRIGELTVRRDSAYARMLARFAPLVFPPKNYVGQTLIHPGLHWRSW